MWWIGRSRQEDDKPVAAGLAQEHEGGSHTSPCHAFPPPAHVRPTATRASPAASCRAMTSALVKEAPSPNTLLP